MQNYAKKSTCANFYDTNAFFYYFFTKIWTFIPFVFWLVVISVHLKSIIVFINYCYISSYKSITRATIWFDNVFYVYVFECFILVGLCKLVVKTVCKLACKQVLVARVPSVNRTKCLRWGGRSVRRVSIERQSRES